MLRRSVFVWMLQFMQMIMPKTYLWRTIYQLGKFKLKLLVWNMRLLLSKVRNLAALNRCFHQEAAVQEVRRFDTKLPIEVSILPGFRSKGAFTNYEKQSLPSILPSPSSGQKWKFYILCTRTAMYPLSHSPRGLSTDPQSLFLTT